MLPAPLPRHQLRSPADKFFPIPVGTEPDYRSSSGWLLEMRWNRELLVSFPSVGMQPRPCLKQLHAPNAAYRHERRAGTHADSPSRRGRVQFLDPKHPGSRSHVSISIVPTKLDEPPPVRSLPDCRGQTIAKAAVRSNTLPPQFAGDIVHARDALKNDVL